MITPPDPPVRPGLCEGAPLAEPSLITENGVAEPGTAVPSERGGAARALRPPRRSAFDRGPSHTLARAPWIAVSAGVHVFVIAVMLLVLPAPKPIRPIDPSRLGVVETTLADDAVAGAEPMPDEAAPPDETEAPFVDHEPPAPDPADPAAVPSERDSALPPPDPVSELPPPPPGPDRAVIGLRVRPERPKELPPEPEPERKPEPTPPARSPVISVPTVDEEYATEINRRAASRLRKLIADPSSGLGRAIRGVKSADLVVVSNGRSFDHLENVLDAVSIPYSLVSVAEFATRTDLSRTRLVFWNCGPPIADSATRATVTDRIRRFVEAGGYLWTTDWALRDVVAAAFPGRLTTGEDRLHTLPELVVDVGPAAGSAATDPLLEGVVPAGTWHWWLDAAAAEVRVADPSKVTVLLEAPVLATALHRKSPVIAATFVAGKGRVLHVMGHAWQEKADLEGTVSMQRLALNFVRGRIERDELPR